VTVIMQSANRRRAAAAAAAVVALFAAGCGSSDSDSSSTTKADGGSSTTAATGGSAELQAIVDKTSAAPTEFTGPQESPPAAKGKFVVSIPCALAAEGCARTDRGVRDGAKAIGWRVQTIDPAGDTQKMNDAVDKAVQLGADAIVLGSIDPSVVAASIKRAKAKGVQVVAASSGTEDVPPEKSGVPHDVSVDPKAQGEAIAAYVATASGGKAKIGILNDPAYGYDRNAVAAMKETWKKCAGCDIVFDEQFSFADLGPNYASQVSALLKSHPDVDWVVPCCDAAAAPIVPILAELGLTDKVKLAATNGNLQNLSFVSKGQQAATVGAPVEWAGWAAIDNLNRLLNGEEVVADDGLPVRLLTQDNVEPYLKTGWTGDVDFQAAYKKLWGT
jgi:ribose transport system substrate-binding protein